MSDDRYKQNYRDGCGQLVVGAGCLFVVCIGIALLAMLVHWLGGVLS